jgi:putative ABC transport system permease protein
MEGFKIALQSLWANKLRSILTLLGVVIGVASVITVVTLVNGAKQFVTTKINSYGADVVTISKMPTTFVTIEEYLSFQKRKDVKLDDYQAIEEQCKSCLSVGALRNSTGKIVYGTKTSTAPTSLSSDMTSSTICWAPATLSARRFGSMANHIR